MIQPPTHDRPSRQSQPFSELEVIVEKEHKKLLACKVLIERRKEEHERQMLEMVGGKSFPCHPMWFQCFLLR
jgi:translation initiation factor 3 subunit A